jgi:hypothetical protein
VLGLNCERGILLLHNSVPCPLLELELGCSLVRVWWIKMLTVPVLLVLLSDKLLTEISPYCACNKLGTAMLKPSATLFVQLWEK